MTTPECVSERYKQDNNDNQTADFALLPSIPVVDFALLNNGDAEELNKLDFACKEWGFFQRVNHGAAAEVLSNVKAAVAAFFDLRLEEKKKYAMAENDVQGYGQVFVVSEEQKLDRNDTMFLATQPLENRNMKYWPSSVSGFKEAVDEYSTEIQKVTEEILANMSVLMGMDSNGLKRLHGDMKQYMRMNYYPPCSRPDLVLGVSPHSDGGSLTVLLQDNDITGLQIKYKGSWIPVKPIPNALVVNMGDLFEVNVCEIISYGAVMNAKRTRMSIATFLFADDEAEIGPVESMTRDSRRIYGKVKRLDYIRHRLGRKMDGKANLYFLKLESESFGCKC